MSLIRLSNGYEILAEGTYIFNVSKVEYNEEFGNLTITLVTQDKKTFVEKYKLLSANGSPNEGAIKSFSFMARVCLNNKDIEEVDPVELTGCFIKATVQHDVVESKTEPGKTLTFAKLINKESCDGWTTKTAKIPVKTEIDDSLDDILG